MVEMQMPPRDPHVSVEPTRVLLVDDHALLRQGMAAIIGEEPDFVVCGEADGVRSAIAAATEGKPDVALIDISIKDGDGLELLRELRNRFPEVRPIVLSMYDESVYAERALRAGARAYIMKAEAAKTVMTAIRLVLRGETYLSPRMAALLADRERGAAGGTPRRVGADRLSDRELQVLRCVGRGLSTREIAEELFISVKTVEAHREHIKSKLGLVSSGELLRYAIEHGRVES
jgi:DNA-binding NarL/FixJ family response regulator